MEFKQISNYLELPDSYHKGINHGTIISTIWKELDSSEVKKAIKECAKNCKGAWSYGRFKDYPTITFRFFNPEDLHFFEVYISTQIDTDKVAILSNKNALIF